MMKFIALAAAGGAIGAAGRYIVGVYAMRHFGPAFPYGTFIVNVVGALLMGLVIHSLAVRYTGSTELRTFVAVGILGGFTTFSAFSLEVANMIERGNWSLAAIYALASVIATVLALFAGLYLARQITGVSM